MPSSICISLFGGFVLRWSPIAQVSLQFITWLRTTLNSSSSYLYLPNAGLEEYITTPGFGKVLALVSIPCTPKPSGIMGCQWPVCSFTQDRINLGPITHPTTGLPPKFRAQYFQSNTLKSSPRKQKQMGQGCRDDVHAA